MGLIASVDGPNRDIYLSAETVDASIHPIDIYRELRSLRRTDESLRVFKSFMAGRGADIKGPGKTTERYFILLNGARIIPYNISHTLTIIGTIITDDGQEGIACFDRFPLSPTVRVDINYVPPQVEVIIKTVSTGGALLEDERAKLMGIPSADTTADTIWRKSLTDYTDPTSAGKQISDIRKHTTNKAVISADGEIVTVYDDDGQTILHQFLVSSDKLSRTPIQ